MSTEFGIECKGFVDSNNGELFYFVKQKDYTNNDFWLDIGSSKLIEFSFKSVTFPRYSVDDISGKKSLIVNYIYVMPVPGPENSTSPFSAEFKVRVVDSSGSYVEVNTTSTVKGFSHPIVTNFFTGSSAYRSNLLILTVLIMITQFGQS